MAYRGPGNDGFMKTVEIAADGQITDSVIDTFEFDTSYSVAPNIISASGVSILSHTGGLTMTVF